MFKRNALLCSVCVCVCAVVSAFPFDPLLNSFSSTQMGVYHFSPRYYNNNKTNTNNSKKKNGEKIARSIWILRLYNDSETGILS